MSEQINQLQNMMEQLIKMVGTNNTSMEALRHMMENRMDRMENKMNHMESRLDRIESNMATKTDIQELKAEINSLKEADQALLEISEKTYREVEQLANNQQLHSAWLRHQAADLSQNQAEIDLLKKAK